MTAQGVRAHHKKPIRSNTQLGGEHEASTNYTMARKSDMHNRIKQLEKKLNTELKEKQKGSMNLSFQTSRRALSPDLMRDDINVAIGSATKIKLMKKLGGSVLDAKSAVVPRG